MAFAATPTSQRESVTSGVSRPTLLKLRGAGHIVAALNVGSLPAYPARYTDVASAVARSAFAPYPRAAPVDSPMTSFGSIVFTMGFARGGWLSCDMITSAAVAMVVSMF